MKLSSALEQALDLGLSVVAPARARAKSETPDYEVERGDGDFELRRYGPMIVAEATAPGERRDTANALFPKLARYIFAIGRDGEEIDMTTPVQHAPAGLDAGARDATEAPAYTLRFSMPSKWTMDTLPRPEDPCVTLRQMPPRRMAVLSFHGRAPDETIRELEPKLRGWLAGEGLRAVGVPEFAYYDPPVTPAPLKLNEIRVEVAADDAPRH